MTVFESWGEEGGVMEDEEVFLTVRRGLVEAILTVQVYAQSRWVIWSNWDGELALLLELNESQLNATTWIHRVQCGTPKLGY
jgi:hypothetical protein